VTAPTIEHLKARTCAHVERDHVEPAALVRIDALPGHKLGRSDLDAFNTAACVMCAGRVMGALYVADLENPSGDRKALVELGERLAAAMHSATLEPSHDLALALIEVGSRMASELGRRPA
jgi:hypothetical protein